jgi:hypothetical protein
MTSLPLLIARLQERELPPRIKKHAARGQVTMKAYLLGMLFIGALGPIVVAEIDPDSAFAHQMGFSILGGILGAGICFCKDGLVDNNFSKMARIAMGNVLCAAAFGPSASYWFCKTTGLTVNMASIVPIGAVLGICGISLIAVLVPAVQSTWAKFVQSKAEEMGGKS